MAYTKRMSEKECPSCGVVKPRSDYYTRKNGWIGYECKPCNGDAVSDRYAERRAFFDEYKLSRGCADCGYREHPAALEFDHLDPSKKSFGVSKNWGASMARIQAELEKCEVVCANCHRVRTENARGIKFPTGRPVGS